MLDDTRVRFSRESGGDVSTVLVNSSNTELAPAMASPSILAMFTFLTSCRDVPLFAVKGLEVMIYHIEDTGITDTHTFIAGLPRMHPLGYGKAWMEGSLFETGFIDKFRHEF